MNSSSGIQFTLHSICDLVPSLWTDHWISRSHECEEELEKRGLQDTGMSWLHKISRGDQIACSTISWYTILHCPNMNLCKTGRTSRRDWIEWRGLNYSLGQRSPPSQLNLDREPNFVQSTTLNQSYEMDGWMDGRTDVVLIFTSLGSNLFMGAYAKDRIEENDDDDEEEEEVRSSSVDLNFHLSTSFDRAIVLLDSRNTSFSTAIISFHWGFQGWLSYLNFWWLSLSDFAQSPRRTLMEYTDTFSALLAPKWMNDPGLHLPYCSSASSIRGLIDWVSGIWSFLSGLARRRRRRAVQEEVADGRSEFMVCSTTLAVVVAWY